MVDPVQQFPRSFKRLFIGAYVVLIGGLCRTVAQDFGNLFPAQSGLNQPSAGSSPQATKTQPMRLAVGNVSPTARGLKRPLDGGYPKHQIIIVLSGLFPQGFELQPQPITNRSNAGLHCLRVECLDSNLSSANVAPLQVENLSRSHAGVNRADQDRFQVRRLAGAGSEQSRFFFKRQDTRALALIGYGDQHLAFAKGTPIKPAFALADIQQASECGEFAVNAGNASSLSAPRRSPQSLRLVGLKISVGDRTDRAFTKVFSQRFGVAFDGRSGAHTGDFAIINVDSIDRVTFQIPLHDIGKLGGRTELPGDVKGFSFLQRFAQSIASFSFGCARAPEGFTLSVFDPRNAGANVSVSGDDLNLVVAGHLLSELLYIRLIVRDGECNRERDSEALAEKKQAYLQGIDVLRTFGQDSEEESDLTSNQKVPRSSRGECIKTSAKINLSKVRWSLDGFAIRRAIRSRLKQWQPGRREFVCPTVSTLKTSEGETKKLMKLTRIRLFTMFAVLALAALLIPPVAECYGCTAAQKLQCSDEGQAYYESCVAVWTEAMSQYCYDESLKVEANCLQLKGCPVPFKYPQ